MMIFRNDDVNPNSDIKAIRAMYNMIRQRYPDAEIYSCVNVLACRNETGAPHPDALPKNIDFPAVDRMFDMSRLPLLENIVSHGLWHLDHRSASRELQEFSIRSSCGVLGTDTFVPPFWRWNNVTKEVCRDAGIKLWVKGDWKNLDHEPIAEDGLYLFHSWKHTPESFERILSV